MAARYIVQRAVTGEFLEWDLPLTTDGPTWELSGPGALQGTITPDVGHLRDEKGRLVLEEWGSYLYFEDDGIIRWGGILISSGFVGDEWQIEAAGFSTYPHGIIYDGDFQRIQVDPVDCAVEIWDHLQSYPDGNLGVQITATPTPVRLGTPSTPSYSEVFLDGVWQRESDVDPARVEPTLRTELAADIPAAATSLTLVNPADWNTLPLPISLSVGDEHVVATGITGATLTGLTRGVDGTKVTKHFAGTDIAHAGTRSRQTADSAAGPYQLVWWNSTDCGTEFDDLARTTPFDYAEVHAWGDDDVIEHHLFIGYPRLGRRRDDLSFVQGANVTNVVALQSSGDEYANTVVGLGSGDGRAMLRRETAQRDGRLRRASVYADKSISDATRMDAILRDELTRRAGLSEITSVDIINHENARIGSWELGDDILIHANLPWVGEIEVWCRIVGWTRTGEDSATLSLKRSDSFHYGG